MATLQSQAMNALRLDRFWLVTYGQNATPKLSRDICGWLETFGW
jgi:hypothetical protein